MERLGCDTAMHRSGEQQDGPRMDVMGESSGWTPGCGNRRASESVGARQAGCSSTHWRSSAGVQLEADDDDVCSKPGTLLAWAGHWAQA